MSLYDALRKIRFAKWGKRLALLLAGLVVVFMIASNVVLRTRLFREWMAFDPESMTMEYDSAYSWFPGRVHVENLRIRGSDSHVQWAVTIARADTFMNPFAFARRRFSASHATADGVTFHMRTRYLPEQITPELLASLPKIQGFADAPLVMPVPPDPADPDYVLWSVDLEDVTAHDVNDVWIDTVHETGNISLHGRWLFRPLRELDFGPSTLEIPRADVKESGRELVENLTATANLRIFSYDVRLPKGLDLLHQFSGDAKVSWETPLGEAFAQLVSEDSLAIRRGDLRIGGELRLERGVLASGTKVHADVDALDMTAARALAAQASARCELVVDDSGLFSGAVESADLHVEKPGAPPAASESTLASLTSRHLDLAHGFDDAHVRLRARGVTTQSLERWIAPENRASAWATGAVQLSADLESDASEPDFRGRLDVAIHDASIAAGPVRVMSTVNAGLDVEHLSARQKHFAGTIDAQTPEPILTVLGDLRMRSRVTARGHVDARMGAAKTIEVSDADVKWVDARADLNARPLFVAPSIAIRTTHVALRDDHLEGTIALDAPRIELPRLDALAALAPFPASTKIVGGTANASARGSMDLATLSSQGDVDLLARDVDVRIDETQFFGNLQVGAHAVARGDYTDFSGTTVVFARGNEGAPRGATPWSATLTLPQARLSNAGGPAFYATLRGEATDASPAAMFVSSETGVPNWITSAFRMRGLRVTGEVIAAPSFFAIRSLDARGEGSFLDLEYSRRGPMKDGAIYLGTGILTGGIDLAGGSARLVPFGAKSWFLQDVEKIRANETSLP